MKNLKVLLAFFISAFMLPCTVLASDGGVAASLIKDPVVDTLFSIIIILSIVIEIKTAGFSGGSLIAILAGLILIGTNWYYEGGQSLEFALYFGGIALIILDILVMYTGIFIGAGFIAVMAGLFFTFGGNMTALYILLFAVLASCVGAYFLFKYLPDNHIWQKITLHARQTNKEGYLSSSKDLSSFEGKSGISVSTLRPTGKISIDGDIKDAISENGFIEKNCEVRVVKVENNYLIVRKA